MTRNYYEYRKEIREFWSSRIQNDERKVCTNDVKLDLLEEKQIIKRLENNKSILEVGSGNGILLESLLQRIQPSKYIGTDFVRELVDISNRKYQHMENISFQHLDMTEIDENCFGEKFDFIISKRAIQNVVDQNLQLETIDRLGWFLETNGSMILVESSINAQNNINYLREKYGLSRINPPFHNLFFDDERLKEYNFSNVHLSDIDNFSTNFYFITRIIYALYSTKYLSEEPSCDHPLNEIALSIDDDLFKEDYSQIKTYIFKKRIE